MDKVKILRTPYQGGFRDFQISANANNIDTNDGNNVQTALDNLNDRLNNDINNRFIQNEESIQNLGKDKTAIFDSIDRLEAQIEDIDALFPSEAITAIIENASAAQVQAIQYAGNQQLSNITNSGLGQVSNIQNKGASQLSAFEAAAADFTDQQIGLIEDAGQAQINSFNTDAAAAAQNQIASINSAGSTQVTNINDAGTTQTGNVNSAGTTQTANVNNAGSTQVTNINNAGSAKINSINSAGAARLAQIEQAIQSKAEQALADIPDDYTELGQQVNDLKDFVDKIQEIGVASAGQLISDNYIEDKVPYLYRQSGGNGADRAIDTIVGGTIAWNQLANTMHDSYTNNGVTLTLKTGHGATITGTATANAELQISNALIPLSKDHVYLIPIVEGFTGTNTNKVTLSGLSLTGYNGGLFKNTGNYSAVYLRIDFYANTVFNVQNYEYQFFDLTQMFGSTIADYIYNLEQATAGAGVAWFRKLFPNSYYPYNAGELMSVSGLQSHVTTGFNQWDEEWELGAYKTDTGDVVASQTQIRCKNFIPVIAGASYFFNVLPRVWVLFYDINYNLITSGLPSGSQPVNNARQFGSDSSICLMPDNCCFVRFYCQASYGTTYKNDICINISDPSKNGTYEPYTGYTYPLDSTLTLRGIPKLDTDNNLYYDGDEYASDGSVKRKYGAVDLGTLVWSKSGEINVFTTTSLVESVKAPSTYVDVPNIICNKYITTSYLDLWSNEVDKTITVIWSASALHNSVWIRDSSYTDAATFKAAMSGVYLIYELATSTSETADPYVNPQIVSSEGTEEYVTTSIIPVGHMTKYPENLRKKLEGLPWNLSIITSPEVLAKATKNYSKGDYLILNNNLYKVTAAIATGATITVGTNVVLTTVMNEIKSSKPYIDSNGYIVF